MLNAITNPAVVAAVGTDHHQFDRLVSWIDSWAADHPDVEVLIQCGTSLEPKHAMGLELIPHLELCERFARSTVVVSHGGPSTIMDARMSGRLPVVLPRDPALEEHVDDHQIRFAKHLANHELAKVVFTEPDLRFAIDKAMATPDEYVVAIEDETVSGVVGFGREIDRLLTTSTTLTVAAGSVSAFGGPKAGFDDLPGDGSMDQGRSA